jgi:hypothetical protein
LNNGKTVAQKDARIEGRKIAARIGKFAVTHTIAATAKRVGTFALVIMIATIIIAIGMPIAIIVTAITGMTGTIAITAISTGIIAATIMAITIAIIIVGTISGIIRRALIIGVDTVHSIITRAQPLALSMTAAISRVTGSVVIMATTPIRSS